MSISSEMYILPLYYSIFTSKLHLTVIFQFNLSFTLLQQQTYANIFYMYAQIV